MTKGALNLDIIGHIFYKNTRWDFGSTNLILPSMEAYPIKQFVLVPVIKST